MGWTSTLTAVFPLQSRLDRHGRRSGRKARHLNLGPRQRVFDRLRDEHGFTGGYTIVRDYAGERERQGREIFVPTAQMHGRLLLHTALALVT